MRRRFIKTTSSKLSQFDINNYITIEALEDNLTIEVGVYNGRAYYGIDGIGWNEYENLTKILLNRGQTISFRGTNVKARFYIDKPCNILGNGYSLLVGDNAINITDISIFENGILEFSGCPIINVASSFLPATTLAGYCYDSMFRGCTSLTTAPELPATTLADMCYNNMFNGCISLVNAPELPATALRTQCYQSMFNGCTSLVNAPQLPATTLANYCYSSMFAHCTSLVTAPKLPALGLYEHCYQSMFYGCTSLVTAPELPAKSLSDYCYQRMFYGCTSLTTAPALPATTLADMCYNNMFNGCSKLNYIKMLATDISAYGCLYGWVSGVSSTGTFVKHPDMTTLPTGSNGIPTGWTVVDDGEESGSKTVNNIYPIYVEEGPDVALMITSEYPVTSTVVLYDNNNVPIVGIQIGKTMSNQYFVPIDIASTHISPTEDDTYIYNLVKD